MSLDVQKRLFALALDRLGDGEPVNELLQITLDEHKVVHVERYDFAAGRVKCLVAVVPEPIRASSDTTQTPLEREPQCEWATHAPRSRRFASSFCRTVRQSPARSSSRSISMTSAAVRAFSPVRAICTSSFRLGEENVTGRLPGDLYRLIPIGSVHCLWLRVFRSTGAAIAGKSITERLCVLRLDEAEHHKIELAAAQGFAAC